MTRHNRTWQTGIGVPANAVALLLSGLLLLAAGWYFGVRPLQQQADTLTKQAAQIDVETLQLRDRLQSLEAAGPASRAELEQRLTTAQQLLPGRLQPFELITDLASHAETYGVELRLGFNGDEPSTVTGQPFSLTFEGTLLGDRLAITSWIKALRDFAPMITVDSINAAELTDRGAGANVILSVWGIGVTNEENGDGNTATPDPADTAPADSDETGTGADPLDDLIDNRD